MRWSWMCGVIDRAERPSLVDGAEQALRAWLAPGRYREGDRLPPEYELAAMLKVSRGTLRSALRRLEQAGEIVRRQGSGTFVGQVGVAGAFGEHLQRLEGYSSYARRQGVTVTATHLRIELRAAGHEAAEQLEIDDRACAITVSRVLIAERRPIAAMHDVFHPEVPVPDAPELRRRLRAGETMLDLLDRAGVEVAFSRSVIAPVMAMPDAELGRRLKLEQATACLALTEVIYGAGENPLLHSHDVFTPGGIEVELVRSVDRPHPAPVTASEGAGRRETHR
jgi:GntR family transcriptional regulator